MSRFMESVHTINSAVRTLLLIIFFGAIGIAGWLGYQTFYADEIEAERKEKEFKEELEAKQQALTDAQKELARTKSELTATTEKVVKQAEQIKLKDEEIAAKARTISEQGEEIDRLEDENLELATSLRLHKFNHRLAEVTVLDVSRDPGTDETITRVEFVEVDNDGTRLEKPRVFDVRGGVVYVDHWVVNFEDKYIEQATDLDRSMALVMFRRIFGESQEPRDGFQLDQHGSRPLSYARGGKVSDLEEKIWRDFWAIANDHKRAKELGIRAIHGDAVSFKAEKGKRYTLQIRASGGPTLLPARDVEIEPENVPAA